MRKEGKKVTFFAACSREGVPAQRSPGELVRLSFGQQILSKID